MKIAFQNVQGDYFQINGKVIDEGIKASRASHRKRIILPIHRKQEAPVQRMLNFLQPGTYIRPHKHPMNGAIESLILLQGKILFFIFKEDGQIDYMTTLSANPVSSVIDIEPDIWHTFLVMEADTVLFECKRGPYDVNTDKEFAAWAPEEGTVEANGWLRNLKKRFS
ncbi:MAG: WbuC family cupin fold metalloprotein [Balneolaceae bacterium]